MVLQLLCKHRSLLGTDDHAVMAPFASPVGDVKKVSSFSTLGKEQWYLKSNKGHLIII